MDAIKFFNKQRTVSADNVMLNTAARPSMTPYEARGLVEDTLNRAMRTVAELEKLHRMRRHRQHNCPTVPTFYHPPFKEEKNPTLGACREATFWLNTGKRKN